MDNKAWEILNDEERQALSLSINHSKSTWEAGEILGKAHYKYLEIHARAKRFFEIFNIYFNKTGNELVPAHEDIPWDLEEFILYSVEKRMGYRDTLKKIGKESPLNDKRSYKRIEVLTHYLKKLRDHEDPELRDLYDLLLEFDRWNNFRILPDSLQEPSAFKRRNKTRLLKHLKNLQALDAFMIDTLINKFSCPKSYRGKILYLPLVSETFPNDYEVIKIKASSKAVKYISENLNLYMFAKKDDANEYCYLVERYLNGGKKDCKEGQKFWPEYRQMIKSASNYKTVNNIIPRRNNLEEAFRDLDKARLKKRKKKKDKVEGENRADTNNFWS